MKRGSVNLLTRNDFDISTMRQKASEWRNPEFFTRNVWFTDKDDNQALSLRFTGDVFYDVQSPFQRVRILESYKYGKMLALDDMVMTTEKDEFHYHEMISHPAMFTLGNAKNLLVIGGGDGGTIREILRHESVEKVTMVEIDGEVIKACKEFLPNIANSFEHPKLELLVDDGISFIKNASPKEYDLIIVDGSDPVGPAEGLFSVEFYTNCYNALKDTGILVAQGESPKFNEKAFAELNHTLQGIFGENNAPVSLFFVPTYPTGMWSFQYGIKGDLSPKMLANQDEVNHFVDANKLRYYNADVHVGSFATPNFVKELLKFAVTQ
jgi:spermidine synthase